MVHMGEYRTIKIRPAAYRALKVLAAKKGQSMLDLVDRLVAQAGDERGNERGTHKNDEQHGASEQ
jgi:hypothetical protein